MTAGPQDVPTSPSCCNIIWLDPETVCYLDYYNPSRACSAGPVPVLYVTATYAAHRDLARP